MTNFRNRSVWTADNLKILRGLNSKSIDLVYADPPFNTQRVYRGQVGTASENTTFDDRWARQRVDPEWPGEIADRRPGAWSAIENAALTHGRGMRTYLTTMTIRLMELQRILKPTGALYLHCDTRTHVPLGTILDNVFGARNRRNQIPWQRGSGAARSSQRLRASHDVIWFYAASPAMRPNTTPPGPPAPRAPHNRPVTDEHGAYHPCNLTAGGVSRGDSGLPWRGLNPSDNGRHWASPGTFPAHVPKPDEWDSLSSRQKLDRLDELGLIEWSPAAKPRFKRYTETRRAPAMNDMLLDIKPLTSGAAERVGFPTQKPVALLDRLITIASNPGDTVLDPFCGSGTACISAEGLGRNWIGIDRSPESATVIAERLRETTLTPAHVHALEIAPQRTDAEANETTGMKHALFGYQNGCCGGCRRSFAFTDLEIDLVDPEKRNDRFGESNVQLLCAACAWTKGGGSQAELMTRLKEWRPVAA